MSAIKETNKKIETAVVEGYKKIEDGVVSGYKKIEDGVVSGYKKIEDKFIDTFLAQDGESLEDARNRITGKSQPDGGKNE